MTFRMAISGLGDTLAFVTEDMGKDTLRMSSEGSQRACYVTRLIDETNDIA